MGLCLNVHKIEPTSSWDVNVEEMHCSSTRWIRFGEALDVSGNLIGGDFRPRSA